MDTVCALLAALTDMEMLTVTGWVIVATLVVFAFVYVFGARQVTHHQQASQDALDAVEEVREEVKELRESNNEMRTALRRQGILKSPRDIESPGTGLKIDRGSA